MSQYNLCIIKPNKSNFSETFIQEHIDRLAGNKKVLYGGAFPVYDHEGKFLIRSKLGLLSYLIQKRLFNKLRIGVRTKALVSYLKRERIDVVFAEYGMVGAMVTEACKLAGVPLVIHYHGADVHHSPTVALYRELYNDAFAYASTLVAVSGDMAVALQELGAPAGKIVRSSCGVDTQAFTPVDVRHSGPQFLAVGRFVEKKSPLSVIKAFKQVVDEYPDALLNMAGGGPLFDDAAKLIQQLSLQNNITLTGVLKTPQIRALMSESRCFVQHSVTAADGDMEGTPVSVLEASASALPVVSTRHAGIKEAVIEGVTGLLCNEHDIDAMAANMKQMAASADVATLYGLAGRGHMIANYDINSRIALLDTVMQAAINNK